MRPARPPLPPLIDAASAEQRARRARWDFVEGVALWKMWSRGSLIELRRRYKRTVLGPAWVTISLLIFGGTLSVVWAGLWHQNVVDFLPFLLSGLIPWTMISAAIGESCGIFLGGEGLVKNQQFPYTIFLYGVLTRNVLIFGHNLIAYLIIAVACGVHVSFATLLFIPGTVLVIINCGWICLLVAVLCLRFRDFQQMVASLLQIAMFVTPVFWAASQLQGKRAIIADVNIFYHMIDIIRQPLLGKVPSEFSYLFCVVSAIVGWFIAYRLYASKRHRLPYWF